MVNEDIFLDAKMLSIHLRSFVTCAEQTRVLRILLHNLAYLRALRDQCQCAQSSSNLVLLFLPS